MAREAKFNFIPENQLTDMARVAKGESHFVTISLKHNYMRLSLPYVRDNSLDGTYVKLYADTDKKLIGWRIMRENSLNAMGDYRMVKIYNKLDKKGYTNSHCQIGIGKLLKALKADATKAYVGLPIKKYANQSIIDSGEIHYVELN